MPRVVRNGDPMWLGAVIMWELVLSLVGAVHKLKVPCLSVLLGLFVVLLFAIARCKRRKEWETRDLCKPVNQSKAA